MTNPIHLLEKTNKECITSNMSSIQERLQLKRVPLDSWNVREQLCLASAVVTSGDQNWMSVSRALKTVGDPSRPSDWYSQKSCAAQYGALLENVETPKRKKRSSEGAAETPQESILKRLTQQRIAEIQKHVGELTQQYQTLKTEIAEVRNTSTSEERVRELWAAVEQAKRARERESARRQAWLREREERRARMERTRTPAPVGAPPSSPLLTSLLKSSPVVTTPQHISHPANVVDAISPSAGAPTLSLLLEQRGGAADTRHAAIEHIKSQLVQIEQQLKANPSTPPPGGALVAAPPVDIDDIEIKAEDVYAFRDVDLEIPPVAHLHKPAPPRTLERPQFIKEEECEVPTPVTAQLSAPAPAEAIQEQTIDIETPVEEIINVESITPEEAPPPALPEAAPAPVPEPEVVVAPPEVNLSFPDVKFPVPEIKVVQQEELKIKEEVKEPEVQLLEDIPAQNVTNEEEIAEEAAAEVATEDSAPPPEPEPEPEPKPEPEPAGAAPAPPAEPAEPEAVPEPDVTSPDEAAPVDVVSEEPAPAPSPPPDEPQTEDEPAKAEPKAETEPAEAEPARAEPKVETGPVEAEPKVEPTEAETEAESAEDKDEDKSLDEIKKEVDLEESTPLAEMRGTTEPEAQALGADGAHGETDDDTPMELVREEDKDGKTRRDYSRKKKPSERTCSGSESAAETSAPDSPTVSDGERQHRLWKKSVMLVYSRLCGHKYASLFQRPITDAEAPGYSLLMRRPMDLSTIKRNIDNGVIRTTAEFQRDVLLMLSNALMYNSSEHDVYQMARDMFHEAETQLGMLLAAQAHAGLGAGQGAPPRRRRHADCAGTPPLPKRRHE